MNCRRLLSTLVLVASLCFASLASADPFDFEPLYTSPTYFVLAGVDPTNELRYATIYIDASSWQEHAVLARLCTARYVSGNLFGDRTNLIGWAEDWAFDESNPNGYQEEGYIGFSGVDGLLYSNTTYISRMPVGNVFMYDDDFNPSNDYGLTLVSAIPANGTAPVPEPASCVLIGCGLLGVWGVRRRLA